MDYLYGIFGAYTTIVIGLFFLLWLLAPVFIFTIRGQVVAINQELRGTQAALADAVRELKALREIGERALDRLEDDDEYVRVGEFVQVEKAETEGVGPNA